MAWCRKRWGGSTMVGGTIRLRHVASCSTIQEKANEGYAGTCFSDAQLIEDARQKGKAPSKLITHASK